MTLAEERAPVEFELSARYRAGAGPVLLTGVQAIARMLVEQHAADAARGPVHGVVRLRLPGQPAGRARPDPRPRHRAAGERGPHARARRSTRSWPPPRCGAASSRCPATAAASTAWSASGTARRPASTAPATRCATATCAAPTRPAGCWCSRATTPAASPPPSRASASARSPATGCRCSTRAPPRRSSGSAATAIALSRASGMWVGMKITADVADGVFALDGAARPRRSRCPELEWEGAPVALPAVPDARAAGIARGRGADVRAALGDGPRVPRRQPDQHRRGRRARRAGWASWRAARRSPTSGRRCATSASTTTACRAGGHPAAAARA